MENKIIMLSVDKLEHHPENPRKNIGDIEELTASIKKDGIFQNLTVVKKTDENEKYLVVIGNRRLEAALAAGLSELPCVISDMDRTKQIETMLVENINRSDLTPIEEAEGFKQLTLAGFSAEDIAEKTGFSLSTVNRRLKIAEYKTKEASAALERGATLADFAKLEKIKSKKAREELLKSIGTNNFNRNYILAVDEQTENDNQKLLRKLLKGKATELTKDELGDTWSSRCKYTNDTNIHKDIDLTEPFTNKSIKLKGEEEVFFCFRYNRCEFFKLNPKTEEVKNDKGPKHTEEQKQYERNRRQLNKLAEEAFELRQEFIESIKERKSIKDWQKTCIEYALKFGFAFGHLNIAPSWQFSNTFKENGTSEGLKNYEEYCNEHSAGWLAYLIYSAVGDRADRIYHNNLQWKHPKGSNNAWLDLIYEFLIALGYEMSDEEKMWQDGSHPLQQRNFTNANKEYNR